MSKVLVTGANGFVGQHLVKELSDNEYEVVGVGGPQGSMDKSKYVAEYLTLDLNDPAATATIDFSSIDYVIHLAGLAAVGASFDDPMLYVATNIGIQVNLFEVALAQNAHPRFLIISSGSLYAAKAELPITENSTVVPSSPYAVSKLGQEHMAQYYGQRGFECIIARPFNHIGPGQGLGFIVPDLTQQIVAAKKGETTEIKVGNLEAKRDYTDVRDIARAYRLLIEAGHPGEIYNICSGTPRSGTEILTALKELADVQVPTVQDESKMRPSDNPIVYGDIAKMRMDVAWAPDIEFEQTLKDVLDYWQN